jgi:hypothetical protein
MSKKKSSDKSKTNIVRSPIISKEENISKGEYGLPKVSITVFCRVVGIKSDQQAGFRYFASQKGLMRLSIPEWEKEHYIFKHKPIGG